MTLEEYREHIKNKKTKSQSKSTANKKPLKNNRDGFSNDSEALKYNIVSDDEIKAFMAYNSSPSSQILDTSPVAQHDKVVKLSPNNDNKSADNSTSVPYNDENDTVEDSIIDDIATGIKNIGRGTGKNLARYSKLINQGISEILDKTNPYTLITGNKTDLSRWFDNAAQTNDYYLKQWNKDSAGSKAALAGEIILDPAIFLPSGVAAAGSKLARIGRSALAGIGQGAGLQYAKDYADGNDPYKNIALAGGLGGAVNAAIAGVTRGKAPNITGLSDNYINEPYSLKKELNQIADEAVELYKKNVRPLTKAGREANIKDDFRNYVNQGKLNKSIDDLVNDGIHELNSLDNVPAPSFKKIDDILDVPVSNNISSIRNTELEKIADDYINENIKTLPKSNYKPLNAKNYDSVINELNKPEFRILNNENIDDILRQDDELMANIANIRRANKRNAKNKPLDEVIKEYEYKDTTVLNKEYNKVLKNISKSDKYKQLEELRLNSLNMSLDEYKQSLNNLQQEILKTDDGIKFQSLRDELNRRKTAPSPENYRRNSLTTAVNISNLQPKSTKPLIDRYNDLYGDIELPKIYDDVEEMVDISKMETASNPSVNTNVSSPVLSGKTVSYIDETTGEVIDIPVELIEAVKKKAQMTY